MAANPFLIFQKNYGGSQKRACNFLISIQQYSKVVLKLCATEVDGVI